MVKEVWSDRIGLQRDWVWRGWQVRFSFWRPRSVQKPLQPPIILLHGFGAAIEHWRHNIPVLGEDRMVYAIDLLGFGGSRKPATEYSVPLWEALVYDFWRTFIQTPVVMMGNSLGSLVCIAFAVEHPEAVCGVVPINIPDVSLRQEMIPQGIKPLMNAVEGFFGSPPFLKPLFKLIRRRFIVRQWAKMAYSDPQAVTDELVEILAAPAYDEGTGDTICALSASMRRPHFSPSMQTILAKINTPILLLWGQEDRMVPFAISQKFASVNPNLQFVALAGVGHCPHDENPDQFHQVVLPWLGSLTNEKPLFQRV